MQMAWFVYPRDTPMAKALTAIAVKNLRPRAERYEVGDGGCPGLGVTVQPSGVKSWRGGFCFRGPARKLTLGPFFSGGQGAGIPPPIRAPLNVGPGRPFA